MESHLQRNLSKNNGQETQVTRLIFSDSFFDKPYSHGHWKTFNQFELRELSKCILLREFDSSPKISPLWHHFVESGGFFAA